MAADRVSIRPARMKRASRAVTVRMTNYGRGVFAKRRFQPREMIGRILGRVIHDRHYGSEYCMDLGQGRALEPDPPFRFVNHSCQPNCGLGGFIAWDEESSRSDYVMYLEALVAIAPGEQLTIDYAWPVGSAIPCLCGSANCRGWIVDPKKLDLLPDLRNTERHN